MKSQQHLIDFRLYRDSCIKTPEGIYIKDLDIIQNRSLKDVIIVDNAVYSFGFHLDNGIPIIPFYSTDQNPNDEELLHLIFYIQCIAEAADMREHNRRSFQLKDLQSMPLEQQMQVMNQSRTEETKQTSDADSNSRNRRSDGVTSFPSTSEDMVKTEPRQHSQVISQNEPSIYE